MSKFISLLKMIHLPFCSLTSFLKVYLYFYVFSFIEKSFSFIDHVSLRYIVWWFDLHIFLNGYHIVSADIHFSYKRDKKNKKENKIFLLVMRTHRFYSLNSFLYTIQ